MTSPKPLERHAPRSHSRHRLRRWTKRIALIVAGVVAVGAIVYAWLPSPIAVDTAVAARSTLAVEITEDGVTRVRDRFVVSAPASGVLERIELDAGTVIHTGDVVARITPPDPALLDDRTRDETRARLAAAIARSKRADAAVARARIARDAAIREATRARALAERGAISGAERDRAESEEQLAIRDVAGVESERTAAASEAAAIRAILERHEPRASSAVTVTAPAGGQILRVLRDSAGPITAGTPLLEIGDPRSIEIVIDVLSSDATRIRPGMTAMIEGWGGAPLTAHVQTVEPSAFTRISALGVEEQRVKVVLGVVAPPPSLGDGFRVDARITVWRGEAVLVVPSSAVFRDADQWAVYGIEDGRARLRHVAIGHRGRLAVEVTSGVAEGTSIILHPGDRVTEAARVRAR
jgi:HlyD family secretion protein